MPDTSWGHDTLIRLDERTEDMDKKIDKLTKAVEDCIKPKLNEHEVRISTIEAKSRSTVWALGVIISVCTAIGIVVLEHVIG